MQHIGNRIKEVRIRCNLTQGELSEKLQIAQSTIGMIETNKREPSNELLIKIANVFTKLLNEDITIDYLLGRKDVFTGEELADMIVNEEHSEYKSAIKEVEYFKFYKKMKKEEIDPEDLIKAYKVYLSIKENMDKNE